MPQDTTMTDNTTTPPTSRQHLPRTAKWLLLAIIVVLCLVWLGFAIAHRVTHVSAQDARVMANQITVSSRLSGRVTDFTLTEGDRLEKGDTVATLYRKPDERKMTSLEANVAVQRAHLDYEKARLAMAEKQLEGGMNLTHQELEASKAAEKAAQARLTEAKREFKRADALYKKGSVSEQRRDQDYYAYQAALAEHAQAQQEVEVSQALADNAQVGFINGSQMPLPNPDVLKKQVRIAEQNLAIAQAKRDEERLRLNDLSITSPSDGIINKTLADQGEYISAGQPILMMHDPDHLWVEANIKETDIAELRVGQPVAITVDAFPDATFKGHISVIGRAATSQFALLPDPNPSGNFTKITQRLPVRIQFDDGPTELIGPGMMVEVDIDVSGAEPRIQG
ncbi:membrane fusion protein (multidrug efflux system) [Chromohalobacter marismortui]|uniref:Membrane fusion protein (Multidrug efflux system) n=1 Tax=Chromohalobacter marismortui TaxID=42055 RepID=A0A4V3F410_9GAMM|nr:MULTISPECIES: HlyD family secretion protein [Chromohalobacter]MCI0511377.1 HlyD family secretion protein [Chromohalobacter sp.]MCI0593977.1 HlyD family secretion protein [Chromohalobacter sp.]TDU23606.1 membrane fusion protein (multidrug efflux system) [Chromohalobacter marismortui]